MSSSPYSRTHQFMNALLTASRVQLDPHHDSAHLDMLHHHVGSDLSCSTSPFDRCATLSLYLCLYTSHALIVTHARSTKEFKAQSIRTRVRDMKREREHRARIVLRFLHFLDMDGVRHLKSDSSCRTNKSAAYSRLIDDLKANLDG